MDEKQYCTFYLDGQHFGVEVLEVQEILRSQELTPVPLAPPVVRGLINLRGQIVTALDVRRRLGRADRPAAESVNVVLRTEDGSVSLLVDEIGDILTLPEADFEPPPETLQGAARALIEGVYKLPQGLLLILNTNILVAPDGGAAGPAARGLMEFPSEGVGRLEHLS